MGTRGYKVYRYRGWYHTVYNHWDSYPSGLGLDLAKTIPRDREKYLKWLEEKRRELDVLIEETTSSEEYIYDEDNETSTGLSRKRPLPDIMIEWTYIIDLDHEIFHVDSVPLFRLDNMPPDEGVFLSSIGVDSYGNRAYSLTTPEEHRYRWKSSPPPVSQLTIGMYDAISRSEGRAAPIHELLGIKETLSTPENMRVQVYQVIIGCSMAFHIYGYSFRALGAVLNAEGIPTDLVELGRFLVALAIRPMAYTLRPAPSQFRYRVEHGSDGVVWPLPRTCLLITTHLDDDHNLKAAIVKLVDAAKDRSKVTRGIIHGIAFSFYHCAVVRVDNQNGDFVISHTPALQFLPSFYATSPSTPGITALVRLGCALQILPVLGLDRISLCHEDVLRSSDWMEEALRQSSLDDLLTLAKNKKSMDDVPTDLGKLPLTFWMQITSRLNLSSVDDVLIPLEIRTPQTTLDRVPLEVWTSIASHVFCGDSLLTLAELTPRSWYAVNEVLTFPHIGRHRVTGIDPAARSRLELDGEEGLCRAAFQTCCQRSKESRYQDTDHIIIKRGSGRRKGEGKLKDVWMMLPRELDSFSYWAPIVKRISSTGDVSD